ncbi:protein of unknown function [Micropruina glycogenica]|uniref:Uncharacterized protein n=1 Tax=Micropruina glycogenica TaxID=75385 RepID=A0A2N9JKP6_9ACTN|nr:protein of unknown function [Micropruina glycogenica]
MRPSAISRRAVALRVLAPRSTVARDQLLRTLLALPYMRDRLTQPDLLVMAGEWTEDLMVRVLKRAST